LTPQVNAATTSVHQARDLELPQYPSDTVSAVRWSPVSNLLSATSWDKSVRIWEVSEQGNVAVKFAKEFDSPVTASDWTSDGTKIVTAHINGKVNLLDLNSQAVQQVGQHQAGLQCCRFIPEMSCVVSAGWDKMLYFWDCRQSQPALSVTMPAPVFAMDVLHPLLITADNARQIAAFNLASQTPTQPVKYMQSTLQHQLRAVACFPDRTGFISTSIEGRCALQYFEDNTTASQNFSFRCHRSEQNMCYAINDVVYHPRMTGVFATCGADGRFVFWDRPSKTRIREYSAGDMPLTSMRFNATGSLLAYSVGYDWHKGSEFAAGTGVRTRVFVHAVIEDDVVPKKKK